MISGFSQSSGDSLAVSIIQHDLRLSVGVGKKLKFETMIVIKFER